MTTRVRISTGALQGIEEQGIEEQGIEARNVLAFRGIPFAAPPLGALRFAAPQAPPSWSGVRDATNSKAAPLQNVGAMLGWRPVGATAEDCLYLDVYTPALTGNRPVMLWLYGGAFIAGSGSDLLTRGHRLALSGDVVVVTCNYRLGAFGFLAAPTGTDATTNAGLRDQIAVLQWIQSEIAHFGGDPNCVTVFGESAGGMSVCNLLASPLARGLFHRAIAQSGFAASVQSQAHANEVRADLCRELHVADGDIEALRACSAEAVLAAQQQVLIGARNRRRGMAFRPALDGTSLREVPLDAIAAGRAMTVPLLIGTNLDEQRLYMSSRQEMNDRELYSQVATRLQQIGVDSQNATAVIALYRRTRTDAEYQSNAAIACAVETDLSFRMPALRLARARHNGVVGQLSAPTTLSASLWMYLLTWKSPALRGWLGACHAIDVPFVFGNLDAPGMKRFAGSGADAEALAAHTMRNWTTFARTGRPASIDWDEYTPTTRRTMLLARESAVVNAPYDEERDFWAQTLRESL